MSLIHNGAAEAASLDVRRSEALLQTGALQSAIFNSANFSSIATDAKGVIQIFNVGAERMLGYTAAEVMNKITPADISDPQEVIMRATALSVEFATPIAPGFEALVFKASRGIEDIYELTDFRKDGSRFPAVVSVTALRDAQDTIIGDPLIARTRWSSTGRLLNALAGFCRSHFWPMDSSKRFARRLIGDASHPARYRFLDAMHLSAAVASKGRAPAAPAVSTRSPALPPRFRTRITMPGCSPSVRNARTSFQLHDRQMA